MNLYLDSQEIHVQWNKFFAGDITCRWCSIAIVPRIRCNFSLHVCQIELPDLRKQLLIIPTQNAVGLNVTLPGMIDPFIGTKFFPSFL